MLKTVTRDTFRELEAAMLTSTGMPLVEAMLELLHTWLHREVWGDVLEELPGAAQYGGLPEICFQAVVREQLLNQQVRLTWNVCVDRHCVSQHWMNLKLELNLDVLTTNSPHQLQLQSAWNGLPLCLKALARDVASDIHMCCNSFASFLDVLASSIEDLSMLLRTILFQLRPYLANLDTGSLLN